MSTGRTIPVGGGGGGYPPHAQYRSTTAISTTASFPLDNTIPQISEGADTGASVTIVVEDAASDIRIDVSISLASSGASQHAGFYVFRGAEADAIGGVFKHFGASVADIVAFSFTVPAASTGSKTFSLRYGIQAGTGTTLYLLTLAGTAYHGATQTINLSATELPPV